MTAEQIKATYPIKEIEELAEQNIHYYLGAIENSARSEQERLIRKVFTNGFMEAVNQLSQRFNIAMQNNDIQVEERPKYSVGDWILIKNYGKFYDRIGRISHIHGDSLDVEIPNITEVEIFSIDDVEPYPSGNNEIEQNDKSTSANAQNHENFTNSTTSSVDYTKYRLDLAKEIAVAMANYDCDDWERAAYNCVAMTNEIVYQLRKTEK